MDIAKYIGLYLLKNQTCYVHGLGSIELRRKPASYDGRNLVPAVSEVVVVPVNTVDDSLSNFIATNEQISISKASNALKDYAAAAIADVQAGKEVLIPAIGSFFEVNGKLQFATAPQLLLTPPAIPAEKSLPRRNTGAAGMAAPQTGYNAPQQAPAYMAPPAATMPTQPAVSHPYPQVEEEKKGGLNWGRVILFVLILLALIGGVAYVAKNILKIGGGSTPPAQQQQPMVVPAPADTIGTSQPSTDTTQLIDTSESMVVDEALPATQPVVNKGPMTNFKVIINSYDERARAEKRMYKLRSYGHRVELVAEDSTMFHILVPVSASVSDTARIMDSLQRTYNPDGVFIY
jgi:nucleoid DNA-binding protein